MQLAFDFASMLDDKAGITIQKRSGPSYSNRLRNYLRRRGGHAAAVDIPSFVPSSEAKHGFASTIHFVCLGMVHSCDLSQLEETSTHDGVLRPRSRFSSHQISLATSRSTSLTSQKRWLRHPRSAMDVDKEAAGHARQAINVQVAAVMLHFGKGRKDAVRMATLLGIPVPPNWGSNIFPHVARHYGKNAETLALHACDINLATEIKMAAEAGLKAERFGSAAQRSNKSEAKFQAAFFRSATWHHLQLQ